MQRLFLNGMNERKRKGKNGKNEDLNGREGRK